MPSSPLKLQLDTLIIGGGIAGLWLANRLQRAGFSLALLEHKALGSDQTIASQGMIHGGMKYTLSGAITGASETIADMPHHWRACLCGEGDVDLRNTRILSDHFYLWSGASITAKLTSFLASKATRGRVDTVPDTHRPPLLRHPDFKGNLYKLVDIVLDVPSLITNLAHNIEGQSFLIDWTQAQLHKDENGTLSLRITQGDDIIEVHAQQFIFCAGQGNANLLAQLGISSPAMQLRPLQQVLVKHRHPFVFFGHCMGTDSTPRLTISTHSLPSFTLSPHASSPHTTAQHEKVWYLGGSLAEKGATMPAEQLIALAQQELRELLPWVDLSYAEWATLPVARAEPLQPNFMRPDNAFVSSVEGCTNLMVAWPTKLTLVPNLANQVLNMLSTAGIHAGAGTDTETGYTATAAMGHLRQKLTPAPIARTPWELAFPPALSVETMLEYKFAVLQHDVQNDAQGQEVNGQEVNDQDANNPEEKE